MAVSALDCEKVPVLWEVFDSPDCGLSDAMF